LQKYEYLCKNKTSLAIEKIIADEDISSHDVLLKKLKERHNLYTGDIIAKFKTTGGRKNTRW